MNARHSISAAFVLAIVSSVSAFAQGAPAPGTTAEPRWYIAAIGGAVSRPPTEPVFGVEIAEHLGRHAQAYATFSYFENLMGQSLRDGLEDQANRLTNLTGDTWSLSGRDRGVSLRGGRQVRVRQRLHPPVCGWAGPASSISSARSSKRALVM